MNSKHFLFLVSFGVAAIAASACTAVTDETATQCRSQADCLARGPGFADTTCSVDRVCVKVEALERACQTNQECIDKNGGGLFTCRKSDSKCVPLLSANCERVLAEKEDLLNDNTVFIGATMAKNSDGQQMGWGLELAHSEIRLAGGLPPASPEGPRRPLAIVACSGEDRSAVVSQSMFEHLADTIQAPAILGPMIFQRGVQGANYFIPRNILTLTNSGASAVTDLADNDLVYRLQFSDRQTATVFSPFIKDVITPKLIAENMLVDGEPIKLALLRSNDGIGDSMVDHLSRSLIINGKPAVDNLPDGNFALFDIGSTTSPVDYPNPDATRNLANQQIIAFKPHVVLIAAGPQNGVGAWSALVRSWPAATPLPYILSNQPAWAGTLPTAMQTIQPAAKQAESRRKYFGSRSIAPDFKKEDFDLFIGAVRLKFPEAATASISTIAPVWYDGVYMFAYSLAAIKNAPVLGPELARGVRKVADASGGTTIKFGSIDYPKGLAAVAAGNNISYVGPLGSYGFDKAGDHPANAELFCIRNVNNRPTDAISSGYVFNVTTGTAGGTIAAECN